MFVLSRYFTLFMNLLNDCSEVEDEGQVVGGRKRGMSRRLASLRHCTVLAMSNLLNANVDSGLMHSIGACGNGGETPDGFMERFSSEAAFSPQVWATIKTSRHEPPSWRC